MSEKCPKCGAGFYSEWQDGYGDLHTDYKCDSVENEEDGSLVEGSTCLRRQLAQQARELEQAKAKLEFIAGSLRRGLAKYDLDPNTKLWYGHMETCRALAAGQVALGAVDRRVGVPDHVRPSIPEQREMGVED